jgi:EPS-associated MarR family transcriptional regulator
MYNKQIEYYFNILRSIEKKKISSQRDLAQQLGFSIGKINYCIKALKEKGLVKISNFNSSKKKRSYAYIITLKGLKEKSRLTIEFMKKKSQEYEELKKDLENQI